MKWTDHHFLFEPDTSKEWMRSHAQIPTALVKDKVIRIFFSSRNKDNQSFISFLDVDKSNPSTIISVQENPILPLGKPGTFDDSGMMPSSIIEDNGTILLYYIGWNVGISVPYKNSIGLAMSNDGGQTFQRMSDGPLLGLSPHDPYMVITPYVMKEKDIWHMWYSSGTGWIDSHNKPEPVYDIKYAHSKDGITWHRDGIICIEQSHPLEAITRPSVIKEHNLYKMWFCYRGSHDYRDGTESYRIGYAQSQDGKQWQRNDDNAGITVASDDWNTSMLAYPNIVEASDKYFMFYNGNSFGKYGFGYATQKRNKHESKLL